MKRIRLIVFGVLIIAELLISSCIQIKNNSFRECIPPSAKWEIPVMATMSTETLNTKEPIFLPSENWKAVATLPDAGNYVRSIVNRSSNEIWIRTDESLYRYRTDTGDWKSYKSISGFDVLPSNLYLAANGELWGIDVSYTKNTQIGQDFPFLSRYDETTDQFQFITDRDGLLLSHSTVSFPPEIDEDRNGLFWMVLNENARTKLGTQTTLYSFDPATSQAARHFSAPNGSFFSDLAVSPDGIVWIADEVQGQLIYYNPATSKSSVYQGYSSAIDDIANENLKGVNNLYFDRMGQLWIQDRGWLEFTSTGIPIWHQIIRSPAFIAVSASPENQYSWERPWSTYQSSDGRYWFTFSKGSVYLNPETGEWCHFTTGRSPVREDSQGNLWISVYGKLYSRYHIDT